MLGILLSIDWLEKVGITSSIAPAPSPFYKVTSINYSVQDKGTIFQCVSETQVSSFRWNQFVRSTVQGPHRRVVTFLFMFALSRKAKFEGGTYQRVGKMIEFHFCSENSWAQVNHFCVENPKTILIKEISESGELLSNFEYNCLKHKSLSEKRM